MSEMTLEKARAQAKVVERLRRPVDNQDGCNLGYAQGLVRDMLSAWEIDHKRIEALEKERDTWREAALRQAKALGAAHILALDSVQRLAALRGEEER